MARDLLNLSSPYHHNLELRACGVYVAMCQAEAVLDSLAHDDWLPSASTVAEIPQEFKRFLDRFPIRMHRPCNDYTIPLTSMRRKFGQFQEDYHLADPTSEDCKLARQLCEIVSQVGPTCGTPACCPFMVTWLCNRLA